MDSCITASIASIKNDLLSFLHVNYGQRTEQKELQSFHSIAKHFNISEKLIINFDYFNYIGGSSLTDNNIPIENANLDNQDIPNSYVPFRNANILSAAVSWAEIINATSIYIGAVEEDSSGYPDCRRSFYDAFEETIKQGTKPNTTIKIITPLINLKKNEIVSLGIKLNSPLKNTWSCYKNNDIPCQKCDSCALRKKGFKDANVTDPILTI